MVHPISISEFLKKRATLPVIDVRSPGEFNNGHVPGAINVPLFSDEERAIVGTLYKQEGREQAIHKGLEFVGPNLTRLVDLVKGYTLSPTVLIYCARGGMRSRSIAMLLSFAGHTVHQLTGGYKIFKQELRTRAIAPRKIVLLGGKTGSGKTAILNELARKGEQVIDLEGLACHKGSSFGLLGQAPQPTPEQFIVNCLSAMEQYDPQKTIWIEHEGNRLGNLHVPQELWDAMHLAPVLMIDVPTAYRAERLKQEYGIFAPSELKNCVQLLEKRLGGAITKTVCTHLDQGNLDAVLALLMEHYDRSYEHNNDRTDRANCFNLTLIGSSPAEHADEIRAFWSSHT
ncbi:TPA: tRNA 2-selenouridine(34) synthase MnmH [Candidatus Dependentiae bacterium]|nr:MAG: tRNA 2-selenouridine synthase [candidate division TM6 bacterium GW2011_GWF2_43_87]HBL98865.1 tRNA 2-selenouridine(34) synthase MnmH [Candidatus Dependentiae bacterium]